MVRPTVPRERRPGGTGRRLAVGDGVRPRLLVDVTGAAIAVPDPEDVVHLQFRRFAGCPLCNLHLRSIVRRHDEIRLRGLREVVVFHSPAEELREHVDGLPFPVLADPGRALYTEFGVESARRAVLSPAVWPSILRAVVRSVGQVVRGREQLPARAPHGGRLGLPADFLIAPDGRILAAKYGEHAFDQWSVDELLQLAP